MTMQNFGASFFPADTGTQITSSLTSALTDNLPMVLVIVGTLVGVRIAMGLFNKYTNKVGAVR